MKLPYDAVIPLLGISPKKPKTLIWKKYMHPYVYSSVLYIRQDLEAAQESISRWMDKKSCGTITQLITTAVEKKEILPFVTAMDGPG